MRHIASAEGVCLASDRHLASDRQPLASDRPLAPLPKHAQKQPNARSDQERLDGLFLHVRFDALFPFLSLLAALIVVIAGLIGKLLVFFPGAVAHLAAQIAEILADLLRGIRKIRCAGITGVTGLTHARHGKLLVNRLLPRNSSSRAEHLKQLYPLQHSGHNAKKFKKSERPRAKVIYDDVESWENANDSHRARRLVINDKCE